MDKKWREDMKKALTEPTEKIVVGEFREEAAMELLEALTLLSDIPMIDHRDILLQALENSSVYSKAEAQTIQVRLQEIWKHGRF